MWENHATYTDTALLFDIRRASCIGEWEREYASGGMEALTPQPEKLAKMPRKPTENKEVPKGDQGRSREELIEELNYLRMENTWLKKLEALAQKKAQTSRKKRK